MMLATWIVVLPCAGAQWLATTLLPHPLPGLQRQLDGPVSDRGAGHLAPLRQLTSLNLGGRSVMTAQGLGFLQSFSSLQFL